MAKRKAVVDKIGTDAQKETFAALSSLVDRCAGDADCYLAKLTDRESSEPNAAEVRAKAAEMIAIVGDRDTGVKLAPRVGDLAPTAVRLAALAAVDHLVQKDASGAADALTKGADAAADEEIRHATKLVALRLRAR